MVNVSLRRLRALAVFLAVLTVLFCAPFLFSRGIPRNSVDVNDYGGPFRHYAARRLQAGQMPLWNPHIFAGTPFLASPQAGVFYPPNQVFWFFPLVRAVNVFTALHLFLNAWGMALFLVAARRRGAAPWLGGAAWGFGFFFIAKAAAGQFIHLSGYSWTGFILLAALSSESSPALLAAAGALSFFSGHLQVTEHTALLAMVLAAALPGGRWSRYRRGASAAAGAAVLVAVQSLPSWTYLVRTTRAAGIFDAATRAAVAVSYSLDPAALKTFLFPGWFGSPFSGTFAAGPPSVFYESYALYLGWIPLALGLWGLVAALKRRRWALPAVATLFLLLALGGNGPLAFLFRNFLETQRAPARFIAGTLWALVWTAAIVLGNRRWRRGAAAALVLAAAADLYVHGRGFLSSEDPAPSWTPGSAIRSLDWTGPFPPRIALSKDVPLQNKGMMTGFSNVNGFEGFVPQNMDFFAARAQPGEVSTTGEIEVINPSTPLFRELGARYALLTGPVPGWSSRPLGPGYLSEDPSPRPLVRSAEGAARLRSVRRPSPERLDTEWETEDPFVALWSERFDPGWRAWSGSREVSVREAFGVMQAVLVDGRSSTVRWRYRPGEERAGVTLAVLGWGFLSVGILAFLKKRSSFPVSP